MVQEVLHARYICALKLKPVFDGHCARVVDVKDCRVEEGVLEESLEANVSRSPLSEVGVDPREEVLLLLEKAWPLGQLFEVDELWGLQCLGIGPRVGLDHRYDDFYEVDLQAAAKLINEELQTPEY